METNWPAVTLKDDSGTSAFAAFGYIGQTDTRPGINYSYGITSDPSSPSSNFYGYVGYQTSSDSSFTTGSLAINTSQALNTYGHALIRNYVPIPAAAWLFGSAVLLLIGVARRKRA